MTHLLGRQWMLLPYSGLFSWGANFRYFRGSSACHENFHLRNNPLYGRFFSFSCLSLSLLHVTNFFHDVIGESMLWLIIGFTERRTTDTWKIVIEQTSVEHSFNSYIPVRTKYWKEHVNSSKVGLKMTFIKNSQEGQSGCARTYSTRTAAVREYLPYASANSCVDRLNTEGGSLLHGWPRLPIRGGNERHRQRQTSKSRKSWLSGGERWEQTLLRLPMEEMRTCQHERLAAESTADFDTRLQQMSALQHKLKG